MKLSKTSGYTIRLLSYMINSELQVFRAGYLSDKLGIPDKYLRKILTDLSKSGFIKSIRGREGGYVFAKNANKRTLWSVIDSIEDINNYTGCVLGFDECSDENPCSLHKAYEPVKERLINFLKTTTIADLKNENIVKF